MKWEGLAPPYATIVADPPWSYRGTGQEFGAKVPTRVSRHLVDRRPSYSTLSFDEIVALPVSTLAARNAHLYLWTTNSELHAASHVMAEWGFVYKTCLTWVKTGHLGLGAYFRNQTEHLLFGVRGSLSTNARGIRTYFTAAKTGHSIKPAAAFDLIELASPGPYVELFARQSRLGWDSWGLGYEAAS